MKKQRTNTSRTITIVSIVIISAVLTQILFSAFAASGSFSLAANKSQVRKGEDVQVTVRANSEGQIVTAWATLTYNPAQLQYRSLSSAGSPLESEGPLSSVGNGYVSVNRYFSPQSSSPYPTGTALLGVVTFRALQDSGNVNINIDESRSELYGGNDVSGAEILSSTSGVSFALTSAPVAQQPQPNNPTTPPSSPAPSSPSGGSSSSGTGSSGGDTSAGSGSTGGSGTSGSGQTDSSGSSGFDSFVSPTERGESSMPIPAPGSARLATDQPLTTRILSGIRSSAPFVGALALISVIAYFGIKYYQKRAIPSFTPHVSTSINSGPAGPGSGVLIGKDQNKNNR